MAARELTDANQEISILVRVPVDLAFAL